MNNKKLLAICIPTYNRVEFVREFLEERLELFRRSGIDVYIADSGDDRKTKEYIESISGYDVYWMGFPSDMQSNVKVYECMKNSVFIDNYKYFWILSDTLRPSDFLIETIVNALRKEKKDLVVLNQGAPRGYRICEYTDPNELFRQLFWCMILYGAVILNTESILSNADWDMLTEKYLIPSRISFSHVCLYFERIAALESFNALHLCYPGFFMTHSALRTESTWYKNDTFEIWINRIAAAASALPDIYTDKFEAWTEINRLGGSFEDQTMLKMREDGILTPGVFFKYAGNWHHGTGYPLSRFIYYTFAGKEQIRAHLDKKKQINLEKLADDNASDLSAYCERYSVLHIVGAGKIAKRVTDQLNKLGVDFKDYLVSDTGKNQQDLNGHPVRSIATELRNDEGYIMGLGIKYICELLPLFPESMRDKIYVPKEMRHEYEAYISFCDYAEKMKKDLNGEVSDV